MTVGGDRRWRQRLHQTRGAVDGGDQKRPGYGTRTYRATAVLGATAGCKAMAGLGAAALGVAALGAAALRVVALGVVALGAEVLGAVALGAVALGAAVLGAAALAIRSCGEEEVGEGILASFSRIPTQSATSSARYVYARCSCNHGAYFIGKGQRGVRRENTVHKDATSNNLKGKPMTKTIRLQHIIG